MRESVLPGRRKQNTCFGTSAPLMDGSACRVQAAHLRNIKQNLRCTSSKYYVIITAANDDAVCPRGLQRARITNEYGVNKRKTQKCRDQLLVIPSLLRRQLLSYYLPSICLFIRFNSMALLRSALQSVFYPIGLAEFSKPLGHHD